MFDFSQNINLKTDRITHTHTLPLLSKCLLCCANLPWLLKEKITSLLCTYVLKIQNLHRGLDFFSVSVQSLKRSSEREVFNCAMDSIE